MFNTISALEQYAFTDGEEAGHLPLGIPMNNETIEVYYDILVDADCVSYVHRALAHRMIPCPSVDIQLLIEPSNQHTYTRCRGVLTEINKQWRTQAFPLRLDINKENNEVPTTQFILRCDNCIVLRVGWHGSIVA